MKFGAIYCIYDDHEYLEISVDSIKKYLQNNPRCETYNFRMLYILEFIELFKVFLSILWQILLL